MTSKSLRHVLITTFTIIVIQTINIQAGIIPTESHHEPHEEHQDHHYKASSYMHFHGPVEGPAFEVKIPYFEHHHHEEHSHEHDHHHHEPHYVMDYVAHPKYEYSYGVEDHHTGDFHSQKETRDGSSVSGEYSIAEPGGRLRIVSYHADKDGFHAHVHTSGKNDHSSYNYASHHHPHIHAESSSHIEQHYVHQQHDHDDEQQLQYPASFGEAGFS